MEMATPSFARQHGLHINRAKVENSTRTNKMLGEACQPGMGRTGIPACAHSLPLVHTGAGRHVRSYLSNKVIKKTVGLVVEARGKI